MSLAFWITTLVIVATPGTGVLFTVAAGLARGRRAALLAAVACTLGIVPHLIAAVTGLAALLHTSALAFQTLKYLGVAYLLILAWSTYRDRSPLALHSASTGEGTPSARQVLGSGILVNLLNPKLTVFFFAFLPQFVPAGTDRALLRMLTLSAVFMAVTLVVFAGYGVFAAAVRRHVIARPHLVIQLRRLFAGSYAVIAGRLATSNP